MGNDEETDLTTQGTKAETPTPLRNKPLFDTANRRVPLNRFRGRQQIKVQEVVELQPEPVQEEEVEQSRRPGGLLTRITAKRPVFKRPVLKKKKILRRPVSSATTTAQPADQGAFLVCSDGRCFDPSTQEEISDTDLDTSATSKLPEDVMRLIEEMRLLEEEEENEEIRKNHIKLLLETAKVEVPAEAPGQKILETDELVEMLRSQGILPSFENTIPEELEKEIIDLEEDFGVPEMERLDEPE